LVRWFAWSLVRWFVGSLVRWFVRFVCLFVRCRRFDFVRSFARLFLVVECSSFVSLFDGWCSLCFVPWVSCCCCCWIRWIRSFICLTVGVVGVAWLFVRVVHLFAVGVWLIGCWLASLGSFVRLCFVCSLIVGVSCLAKLRRYVVALLLGLCGLRSLDWRWLVRWAMRGLIHDWARRT